MSSVNMQIVVGGVGLKDPLRYNSNGTPFIRLRVWTKHTPGKGRNVEPVTTWHNLMFSGAHAEAVDRHVEKGTHLYAQGRTEHRESDGRWFTNVWVDSWRIISGGRWPDDADVRPSHKPQRAGDIHPPETERDPLEHIERAPQGFDEPF